MEKIAIIDLGSNSARLALVRVLEGGYFYVFDELKESVRLAQDLDEKGVLQSIRVTQTIKTLQMFKSLCDANNITNIYAFATAAVRRAKNQRSFLEEVADTCGFRLKVLDADEEAKLIHTGVVNSIDVSRGLIMDIGGGSTQLVYYNRRNIINSVTLPYGSVNLTDLIKSAGLKPEEKAQKIEDFFLSKLNEIDWLKDIDPDKVSFIGVGGSFRNVGKISRKAKNYPLDLAHNYQIGTDEFTGIYKSIRKLELDKTMKIKGLSNDRADIFPSALAAMYAVIKKLKFKEMTISGCGLREGVMFRKTVPSTNEKPITDILGHSLYTMLLNYGENIKYTEKVYDLCLQLYNQLKVLHKLPRGYVKILRTAAMLHSTGNRVSFYDYQKHSTYIILNSRIFGMSHKDLVMAAFASELHRHKDLNIARLVPFKNMLTQEDVEIIYRLGVILRIAASFNRTMSGAIKTIKCEVLGDSVIMQTEADGNCELEIKAALKASSMFKKAYNKNLQIL